MSQSNGLGDGRGTGVGLRREEERGKKGGNWGVGDGVAEVDNPIGYWWVVHSWWGELNSIVGERSGSVVLCDLIGWCGS